MLDTETKRRIDTARDILVGKVPDPKSQVEQITIALIYKFMADMDAESEEMGGKRTFFSGEWERYGWPKLMRSGLGGHEVLALYGEAISKMPENAGIPTLFRDIFKNAYLPYRDPETLKSFLKVIDEFEYDHSERLGIAVWKVGVFENVAEEGGDAGVFRHFGDGFAVEGEDFVTTEAGAHELGPAVAFPFAGEESALTAHLLGLGVHVGHELVDEGDGDLLDLGFRVGDFADEDIAGGVDTAFGFGV